MTSEYSEYKRINAMVDIRYLRKRKKALLKNIKHINKKIKECQEVLKL